MEILVAAELLDLGLTVVQYSVLQICSSLLQSLFSIEYALFIEVILVKLQFFYANCPRNFTVDVECVEEYQE